MLCMWRIAGALKPNAFCREFSRIIKRHKIICTQELWPLFVIPAMILSGNMVFVDKNQIPDRFTRG
jgi:hypothetical protein